MFSCFYVYVTLSSLFFLFLILFILTTEISNVLISPPEIQWKLKKEIAENTGELEYEHFMKVLQISVKKEKNFKFLLYSAF